MTLDLLITLDRTRPSLRAQIEEQLREAVRDERLMPGTSLPSSRSLAGELGVSRGVVVEAYSQLAAEGYLISRPGGIVRVRVVQDYGRPEDPDAVLLEPPKKRGRPPKAAGGREEVPAAAD